MKHINRELGVLIRWIGDNLVDRKMQFEWSARESHTMDWTQIPAWKEHNADNWYFCESSEALKEIDGVLLIN